MALRTSLPVQPHLYLADTLGRPLDGGKVFFGEVSKDPELYPINVFYDDDLTIAAPQPIRSKGGFMNANGDMVEIYASEVSYSVKVLDSYGRQVFYAPDMSRASSDDSIIIEGGVTQKSINMGFSDTAAIKAITGANIGMRVYSTTLASNFIFKASSTSPVNGGTVLQGVGGIWEMEDKDAYFASWFAVPNVETDQSGKIQAGYDYATSKGKPFIIDDVYHIKAQQTYMGSSDHGLIIRSNSVLEFAALGELKLITLNQANSKMVTMRNIDNYKIINPRLTGDRRTNSGINEGEWGYGLAVYESSNGYIERPECTDFWGDGIYIGKSWGTTSEDVPTDITILEPRISGIRRNGMSLTSGNRVSIIRPYIEKVGDYDGIVGTYPKACIDIEPENEAGKPQARLVGCIIESPTLTSSYAGVYFYGFLDNLQADVHIKGVTTLDGITQTGLGMFHGGASGSGDIIFDEVFYKTSPYAEFMLGWNKLSNLKLVINKLNHPVAGNFIISSLLNGAFVGKTLGNVTVNNIITKGYTRFSVPEDNTYLVDGYRFCMISGAERGIGTLRELGYFSNLGGRDTYIDSIDEDTNLKYESNSIEYGNESWMDGSANASESSPNFVNTANDFRVLKIGLKYDVSDVKIGIRIRGLSVLVAGVIKTQAVTLTRGGWLKFQNTAGGNTRIIDSYGVWTFS